MDFVFADDARQPKPSRKKCGPLVAIGGIHVPGDRVGSLERTLVGVCDEVGFPRDEQFKWSPGKKEQFQKLTLGGAARIELFARLLGVAADHEARAFVVAADTNAKSATGAPTPEEDTTSMFLERAEWSFAARRSEGVVVAARPGGGAAEEGKFVDHCLQVLSEGTKFSTFAKQPLGVMVVPSRRLRSLQLADIVTSATLARVAGERSYSAKLFASVLPLLRRDGGRIGGIGLKLHPDLKYGNLYHWLLDDDELWKAGMGHELPHKGLPYFDDAGEVNA